MIYLDGNKIKRMILQYQLVYNLKKLKENAFVNYKK